MFDRWRATVFSLMTSAVPIWRLVRPAARLASTCAVGQPAGQRRDAAQCRHRRGVGQGAQPGERSSGGRQLQLGTVGVAERPVGPRQQQPDAGAVVRDRQLLPSVARVAQHRQCLRRPVVGEKHSAAGLRCRGREPRAVERRSRLGELVGTAARERRLAHGQRDLDVRSTEAGTDEPVVRLGDERGPDRGRCGGAPACASRSSAKPGCGSRPSWCAR